MRPQFASLKLTIPAQKQSVLRAQPVIVFRRWNAILVLDGAVECFSVEFWVDCLRLKFGAVFGSAILGGCLRLIF